MSKLRVYVRDSRTGEALRGIPLVLEAYSKEEANPYGERLQLNIPLLPAVHQLATDFNGYVSFPADCCGKSRFVRKAAVYVRGRKEKAMDITDHINKGLHNLPIEMVLDEELYGSVTRDYQSASVLDPDKYDFQFTNLARNQTTLLFGSDACERMVPQHVQKECFELYQIIPDGRESKIEVLQGPAGNLSVQKGGILLNEVCWNWLGYSMGKLVNSISLAPCETMKVRIRNWRIDSESRSEARSVEEFKEMIIEESMKATMRDIKAGLNVNLSRLIPETLPNSWPGLFAYVFKSLKPQSDLISLGIQSQKQILNRITSNTSRLRTRHQVALQSETVEGSESTTARTITNLNQCHSQTTNFFEVNDNYEVTSCLKERRQALLIQYPNKDFTKERIFCHRHIFTGRLLDPELESCLASIGKVSACCEGGDDGSDCVRVTQLRVRMTIGRDGTGSRIRLALNINGTVRTYLFDRNGNRFKKGESYELVLNFNGEICASDIINVGLQNDPDSIGDGAFTIDSLSISYSSPDFSGLKPFFFKGAHGKVNRHETDWFGAPSPELPPQEKPATECSSGEDCCSEQLLTHFNCNKLYYNQMIWWAEDVNTRIERLSAYEYDGAPLPHSIGNRPLAVWGTWVAFELEDGQSVTLRPCIEAHEIVTLPTAGLFSETLLGQCNSCEKPDEDLYKIRHEHPCGCGCGD